MKKETCECMVRLLRARSLMLRVLAAANEPEPSALLSRLSSELRKLQNEDIARVLRQFEQDGKDKVNSVLVPLDAMDRLREAYGSEQLSTIARVAESLAASGFVDADCIQALRSSSCLKPIALPKQDRPASYRKFLLRAATCGETLAYLGAICVSTATQSKPRTSRKKSKKKANKENIDIALNDNAVSNYTFVQRYAIPFSFTLKANRYKITNITLILTIRDISFQCVVKSLIDV